MCLQEIYGFEVGNRRNLLHPDGRPDSCTFVVSQVGQRHLTMVTMFAFPI